MSYLEIAKKVIRRVDQAPSRAANPEGETSEISSFSRGVSPEVEHWDVKRIEIPSQTKSGYVDVWMIATDLSDDNNWRLWFAGTESVQTRGKELS